jgi:cob(I)alamin adenosyltransferase
MKIYTRAGDAGQTGLFGGPRVSKHDARIEAYGTVDELNASLGIVRASAPPTAIDEVLQRIQNELFTVGSQLATPQPEAKRIPLVGAAHVAALEHDIDRFEDRLPPLKVFVLPGGTSIAAGLHLARTICRRAERRIVAFAPSAPESVTAELLAYTNRLSDLLFVLARVANHSAGHGDVAWEKPK